MMKKLKFITGFLFVFISTQAFSQNTYYINPGAISNGDGTMGSPYDGWDKVFPMEAGAIYLQKAGTTWNDSLAIEAEGVTIGSYGDANDMAKIIATEKDAISNIADTAKNVTIKDLWITTEGSGKGIYWSGSATLNIENVEVDSTDGYGIHIDGVDNFAIRNSHIHHNDRPLMIYNSDNWLIEYCDIHDGKGRGALQTNNTNGGLFRYNKAYNDPNNKFLLFLEGSDTFMYNMIYNSGKAGIYVLKGINIFIGNTVDNTSYGVRNKSDQTVLKNNIFSNMANRCIQIDGALPAESDYNLFSNYAKGAYLSGSSFTLAEWQAQEGQTLDLNSIEGDANYVDIENYNFELTDSSAAIDAGAELGELYKMALDTSSVWPAMVSITNQDDQGNSWEIGAYAYPTSDKFGTLSITSENGTVTPAERTYLIGTEVELTAKGNLGFAFESWSGDVSSTDNPLSLKVDSSMSLTANYTKVAVHNVTASTRNATVNFTDSTVNIGTEIILSVEPDSAYAFVNWTDAMGDTISSQASFTLTVDKDYELTANTVRQYSLSTIFPKGGSVVPIEGIYNEGTVVEVEASASFGYTFTGWSGDASGTDAVITVTMDSDKEVIAAFQEAYMLTLNSDSRKGSLDQETGWYIKDTSITITATAKEGYQFLNWMGGPINSTENPLVLTLINNMTITANYIQVFNLNITAENGRVNYSDTVIRAEERIELIATADEGYVFTGWTGDISGDQESVMVTVNKDMNITANFTKVVGIKSSGINAKVSVYPNPAVNFLNILIEGKTRNYSAEILNMTGLLVMDKKISNNDELNISGLKSGIYILRILDEDQLIHRANIIIK